MEQFSETEKQVLKILGRKKMMISEIVDKYLDQYGSIHSIDPKNYFALVVRRITRKCQYHKLPWTLVGKGSGRNGRMVWKAPA